MEQDAPRLIIRRKLAPDPNSAEYSVSLRDQSAVGDLLLRKVRGLEALRAFLQKLNLTEPAAQTVCAIMTERPFHEIVGVNLAPALIREIGM